MLVVKLHVVIIVLTHVRVTVIHLAPIVLLGVTVRIAHHLVVPVLQIVHVRLAPMIVQVLVKTHVKKTAVMGVRQHVHHHVKGLQQGNQQQVPSMGMIMLIWDSVFYGQSAI